MDISVLNLYGILAEVSNPFPKYPFPYRLAKEMK